MGSDDVGCYCLIGLAVLLLLAGLVFGFDKIIIGILTIFGIGG